MIFVYLCTFEPVCTSSMFTKLSLKFTYQEREKKRSDHGKSEKNECLCCIVFLRWWRWRWSPTEIVSCSIDVRWIHAVAAALMAVAISGTSMENIPLPRWFTRLALFLLDTRLRAGFLVTARGTRFRTDRFMLKNVWTDVRACIPFIVETLAQRCWKEPIRYVFPEPISFLDCETTNQRWFSWTNQKRSPRRV